MSTSGPTDTRRTFESLEPATGDIVGVHPIRTSAEVAEAVDRARIAASWWAGLQPRERQRRLAAFRARIVRRMPQIAGLIHRENGKPVADAELEVVLTVDHLAWAGKHAHRVLGTRRRSPGLLMANQSAQVAWEPFGVVGVIGPWNYPLFTPSGSIVYALAAGNAVVFKPSEHTPGVGEWLAEQFREVVPEQPVLQVVTGFGETGAALCRSGVDKLAFTGSTATAKRVMSACAESLTPVLIECGGKDAMLVDEDADVAAAADAAVWGAMSNGGQSCIGIERAYVHERVYDDFLRRVADLARGLRAGDDDTASYGAMTMPAQLEVVRRHVEDALRRGARAVVGGLDSVGERAVAPVVLTDVPEESSAVTEETFGPTLVVNRVRDMDDALARANATTFGLGAAVFSGGRGRELAARIRAGMVTVNSALSYAAVPSLPFGGVGDSGFGRIHGEEGLKEFARPKAIVRQRFAPPFPAFTFSRTRRTEDLLKQLMTLLYGRG